MRYSFMKAKPTDPPKNWNEPGWHADERTQVIVYRHPDSKEVILYVIEPD